MCQDFSGYSKKVLEHSREVCIAQILLHRSFWGGAPGGQILPQATPKKTAEVITNHPETRMGDKVLDQLFVSQRPLPEKKKIQAPTA